jgi:RNA polymerase sigma factor (sigma-70 family)
MARRTQIEFQRWLNIDGSFGERNSLAPAVLQIVGEMQSWIEGYASRHLHPGASTWEFRDRFCGRLKENISDTASSSEIRSLIEKIVKDLIHNQNRTELRRDSKYQRQLPLGQYVDPQSDFVEQKVFRESSALAVLRAMPEKDRAIVEQLYGLGNIDSVSRREMAERLGVSRNTLDQRLRRIFHSVRKSLRS